MRRQADEDALVADALEQIAQHVEFVLPVQPLRQRPVGSDADGLALGRLGDALGMAVPVRLAQAQPVELHTRLADAVDVLERPLGVAVLPGVDAGLLAALEQFDDALGSVPVGVVAAE